MIVILVVHNLAVTFLSVHHPSSKLNVNFMSQLGIPARPSVRPSASPSVRQADDWLIDGRRGMPNFREVNILMAIAA